MKNQLLFGAIATSALVMGSAIIANPAQALSFNFGCDSSIDPVNCAGNEGGIIDITSSFDSGSYLYTVKVDNTSSIAVVTGFGFDFDPNFQASDLIANSLSVVRADGTNISSRWSLSAGTQSVSNGSSYNGISLDFIDFDGADTGGRGGINASGIFNTTATPLFDGTIQFRLNRDLTAQGALLRLQRTGNGGGSLKLVNDTVPTPAAVLPILGGLFGAAFRRKKGESAEA